ncbi:MAG: MotA/TolQ/ExbB proton channel family protein [Cytophagaceae bacterium]|jgi:biopolymer transport protein ExbB|nr:MotA/TolQ/ExbB proton channel family protein [Cytophagaceae bacterium]
MDLQKSSSSKFNSLFTVLAIVAAIVVCNLVFWTVFKSHVHVTDKGNYEINEPGDVMGTMFLGGVIVPFLMSFAVIVLIFSVERAIAITKAYGSGSLVSFIRNMKVSLSGNNIDDAITHAAKQRGSVGNVCYEVLNRYKAIINDGGLSKDHKLELLKKETEEATALELPMMEKNLTILATMASVSTLVGLLGTVIGMIKAFGALAAHGSPDPSALAMGISEALINTALGIGTSAVAIVAYNFFTSKIDELTYSIDEVALSIQHSMQASAK